MKRILVTLLAMLLIMGMLCSVMASAEGVEIAYMHGETDEERVVALQKIIDSFMAENEGITVTQMVVNEDDFWTKLAGMITSDSLPAVVDSGTDMLRLLESEECIDTAANAEAIELAGRDRFYNGALNVCGAADGNFIGVPVSGWVSGVWYRKSWFEEKGLEAPTTWENILKAAEAFYDEDNKIYGIVFPTELSEFTEQIFNNFCASCQYELFDADGKPQFDSEKVEEILNFYQELYKYALKGSVGTTEVKDTFVGGHAAMGMYSTYILGALRDAGLAEDIGFAVPTKEVEGGYGMTTTLGITSGLSDEERDAAVKFVAYMCDPDMNIIRCHMAAGGANPTLRDVSTKPEYLENDLLNDYSAIVALIPEAFENMSTLGFQDGVMHPAMGNISAKMIIPQCIYDVTVGGADVKASMAAAQEAIQAEVDAVQ